MTNEQWARFVEAIQVAYAKRPEVFRSLIDAMPEDARQAFVAGVFRAAADHMNAEDQHEKLARAFEEQAADAADPNSNAYAYPPVAAEDAGTE